MCDAIKNALFMSLLYNIQAQTCATYQCMCLWLTRYPALTINWLSEIPIATHVLGPVLAQAKNVTLLSRCTT